MKKNPINQNIESNSTNVKPMGTRIGMEICLMRGHIKHNKGSVSIRDALNIFKVTQHSVMDST